MDRGARRTNRWLVVEILMVLVLGALAILFFVRPAAERSVAGPWWRWVLLALLFFAVVGLHTWRRRRAGLAALHQTIRDEAARIE